MQLNEVVEFRPRVNAGISEAGDVARNQVLLLQGPVGPFFRMLQDAFEAEGIQSVRITFNPGDRHFSGKTNAIRFAGGPTEFGNWLERFTADRQPDVVILFGAMRPLHQIARQFFSARGVPVLCLEEGYIRPGYITAELGGNNNLSPVAGRMPDKASMKMEVPHPASARSSFRQMARHAFAYYTIQGLLSGWGERRSFHKRSRANIVREAAFWVRNYYRRLVHSFADMRLIERLLEVHDGKYFIVPFQVADDAQLVTHAGRGWNNELMAMKLMASFAKCAPADHRLVFKIHPLERGHTDAYRMVSDLADQLGIRDRVDVVDTGSIGLLTRHSAGMVTINSTSGLSALFHGVRLGVLGKAIYANKRLCNVLENPADIDRFWTDGMVAKREVRNNYLSFIRQACLLPGDYYLPDEQRIAIGHLLDKVRQLASGKAGKGANRQPASAKLIQLRRRHG